MYLDLRVVRDSWLSIGGRRDDYRKDTEVVLFHRMALPIPVIWGMLDQYHSRHVNKGEPTEVANKGSLDGIGGPFPVCDAVVRLGMKTEDIGALKWEV